MESQHAAKTSQKDFKRLWSTLRSHFGRDTHRPNAQQLSDLMAQSRDQWLKTGEATHLSAAISYAEQAVASIPEKHPDRVESLKALWTGLFTRFRNFNHDEDLDRAVMCEEQALELIQDHPANIRFFKEIGVGLYLRYQMKDDLADLDNAIMCGETAVVASEEEQSPDYHKQLGSVAIRISERFARRGKLEDLDQSIAYMEEAINIVAAGDPNLAPYLDSLIVNLALRCEENQNPTQRYSQNQEDLHRAASLGQQLLNVMTLEQPERSSYLTNIGNVFHTLFRRTGNLKDLTQAIQYGHQALETTRTDHQDHANHFGSLGIRYRDLYSRLGRLADLETALDYLNIAFKSSESHKDHAFHTANRAMVLHDLYLVTNKEDNLDQAISQGVEAVGGLHAARARIECLLFLCIAYTNHFERSGLVVDLDTAERYGQEALQELTQNKQDSALSSSALSNISRWRFQISGALSDLRQAVLYGEVALGKSSKDEPTYPDYLINHAGNLMSLYGRTGHGADLEQAIRHCELAVQFAPHEAPKAAEYSAALGSALTLRFSREKKPTDLDNAISYGEKALNTLSQGHVYRARFMIDLAQRYRVRFERERDESDFRIAMQYYHDALRLTPEDHVDYARSLSGLSSILHLHHKHTGHTPSLSDAISFANQAINVTSREDPERAALLNRLGSLLFDKWFDQCRSSPSWQKDVCESSTTYLRALNSPTAFPIDRLIGGYLAASALATTEDYIGAEEAIVQTLALIPTLTFPTNSREDLQYALPKVSGLGILAASVLYRCGKSPVEAIHALEDSRGIISSITINARSRTDSLKTKKPDLWSHHNDLQNEIAALTSATSSFGLSSHSRKNLTILRQRLQDLSQKLGDSREMIRKIPGFSRFLLSPSEQDMYRLAENGDIVCLNCSSISSEAFLITTKRIWVLPLPDLLIEDTEILTSRLARAGNLSRRDASLVEDEDDLSGEVIPELSLSGQFELLWTAAVRPIIQELGYLRCNHSDRDVRDLPRLWWVGRGKMGFAPLHAAGTHTPGSTENTVSHVLSSYATSLKALQFIKEKSTRFKRNIKHNMLLVSAPTTPGHDDLNVKDEVSAISKSLQAWATLTSLEYPSKLAVLSALTTCSLAHFACHGTADRVNPAKSALLLPQRNGAHLLRSIERLTVEDLDNTWSTQAQIVYLSACSTAENKAKYLVDEDIHLASSFQLLGFPHVICTLWGADDDASVEVARSFYKRLETCEESERAVAENLHLAILGYRNVGENFEQILKWAPFIHLGC